MKIKTAHEIGIVTDDLEEIKITGQKELRFFLKYYKDSFYKYEVTEFSSGCIIASGRSKKEVREIIQNRINKYGIDFIIKHAIETIKKYGLKYPINL